MITRYNFISELRKLGVYDIETEEHNSVHEVYAAVYFKHKRSSYKVSKIIPVLELTTHFNPENMIVSILYDEIKVFIEKLKQ